MVSKKAITLSTEASLSDSKALLKRDSFTSMISMILGSARAYVRKSRVRLEVSNWIYSSWACRYIKERAFERPRESKPSRAIRQFWLDTGSSK